jgi:hypothetical protein
MISLVEDSVELNIQDLGEKAVIKGPIGTFGIVIEHSNVEVPTVNVVMGAECAGGSDITLGR